MVASFDVLIHNLFFHWGKLVFRHKFCFFIIPIVVTLFLTVGFKFLKQQTTIDPEYVFSPTHAPWRYERQVLKDHWPLNEQEFWPGKSYDYQGYVDVIAAGKMHPDKGRPNMLNLNYIYELDRINKYIIHNLTVPVVHNGKVYDVGFTDLCMSYDWKCYMNDHLTILMPKHKWGDFSGKLAELADDIITNEVKVTYPIGYRGTEPIYFGAFIGAPHLTDEEGHFDYVRAVRLTYNVREEKVGNISYLWRKKVADYLSNVEDPASDIIEFGMFHNESLPEGLQEVADSLAPKFMITCIILFSACGLSSVVVINHKGFFAIDWVRSKPSVALAGLFCPLLSILSGFGAVLWLGSLYNAIVNVSPFIVFCIGVDDMFLMSAAWHRTNSQLTVPRRLSETLAEAAVEITITTLTDMITFGIGVFTPLPCVQMFCLYTFMGITFTYIYQITFFTAAMAYAGDWESKGLHAVTFKRALPPEQADTTSKKLLMTGTLPSNAPKSTMLENVTATATVTKCKILRCEDEAKEEKSNNKTEGFFLTKMLREAIAYVENMKDYENEGIESHVDRETFISNFFRQHYGPFLLAPSTKKAVFFVYAIYLSLAVLGCSQVEEGLNPKFLVKESFYLYKFYILMDETFWAEGLQMQVVVNTPPNFFNHYERKRFDAMMNAFENTHYTMKHNATMFWLTAFEKKLKEDQEVNIPRPTSTEEWYERCREWLISAGGRRLWEKDMVWGTNSSDRGTYNHLYAFRFQLGLRHYNTPTDHMRSAILMRETAARFPEFNITTFHEYYPFADQYIELKPALYSNCVFALVAMLLVSFVMIPNYGAAFVIGGMIVSIDLGVIGYMTFWGVRLDSVSMITVIMCIGFAVDLSAHIGYAYVKADGDQNAKAVHSLESVGWPVFMGAFTTVIGIMVLAVVDAYIIQIFFKTTFLVIIFSLAHGLIFLPIFLTAVLPHAKNRAAKPTGGQSNHNSENLRSEPPLEKEVPKFECNSADEKTLSDVDLCVNDAMNDEKEDASPTRPETPANTSEKETAAQGGSSRSSDERLPDLTESLPNLSNVYGKSPTIEEQCGEFNRSRERHPSLSQTRSF